MSKSSKVFKCSKCDEIFDNAEEKKDHSKLHKNNHTKGVFKCEQEGCDQIFSFKNNLRRHIQRFHSSHNLFKCKFCSKTFKSSRYVSRHVRDFHVRGNTYVCELCHKVFPLRNSILGHLKYAHGEIWSKKEVYTCDGCRRTFNKKTNLQSHILGSCCSVIKIDNTPLSPCPKCGKLLKRKSFSRHRSFCSASKYRRKKTSQLSKRQIEEQYILTKNKNEENDTNEVRRSSRKKKTVDYRALDDFLIETNGELVKLNKEFQNFAYVKPKNEMENNGQIDICGIEKEEPLDITEDISKVFEPTKPFEFVSPKLTAESFIEDDTLKIKSEIKEEPEEEAEQSGSQCYHLVQLW